MPDDTQDRSESEPVSSPAEQVPAEGETPAQASGQSEAEQTPAERAGDAPATEQGGQTDAGQAAGAATEQAAEATTEEASKLPEATFSIEDAGTLKKKLTVTVPRQRVDAKFNELFGELAKSAQVPGFRIGHAPRRLIEKRFGKEISTDVRNALVGESLGQISEKAGLQTIGEPTLDLEKIEVPETGDLTYSFEVEVAPEFTLPELKGIKVTRRSVTIDDERIDEALDGLRRNRARHETVQEPAADGDVVLAGARITGEGVEPLERRGLTLRVAPGQIEGLPLLDLGTALTGKRPGDTAVIKVKAPDVHPNESWRGKELTVELAVSEVRRTVLPEIDDAFATGLGFDSLAQLREQARRRMESRVQQEVRQNLRDQVCKYLLDSVKFDLPEGVVQRHAGRLTTRRYLDLMYHGVPAEKIEEHLTAMKASIDEQAKQSLRLSFILGKYAEQEKIEVDDGEINSRVAAIAQQNNRRPERLRQEMEADGSLSGLADSLREEKALDKLLEMAEITDAPVQPEQQEEQGQQEEPEGKTDQQPQEPKE
ncbi:MAG: trigger factor [Phycisphaerae bacterium]